MAGLLPLRHLGPVLLERDFDVAFRGTFDFTLDAKNRLTVPARYRAALADGVVLALPVDLKPCVCIWHPGDYESYSSRALDQLPPLSPRLGEMERFLYGNSVEAELDAAGRVIVAPFLSRHAGIEKDVVIVGTGPRLELWSRDRWSQHTPELLGEVQEITASFNDTA